ncbi:MAG: SUMF1/EgtB/PvdO family nonheme iron enzyme [Magnetococcales bacterium]|nr:SUMF1/EgtB/PvdO family nonheme iron enzyme [Magnetococcales bacterium]
MSGLLFRSGPKTPVAWRACLLDNGEGGLFPELIEIPAGEYALPGENPDLAPFFKAPGLNPVRVEKPFLLQTGEVTVREFQRYVDAIERMQDKDERSRLLDRIGLLWKKQSTQEGAGIRGVSWEAAEDFAAWLAQQTGCNYRLPLQTEWAAAVLHLESLDPVVPSRSEPIPHGPLGILLWGAREWTGTPCPEGYLLVGEDDWVQPASVTGESCMPAPLSVGGFRVILEPENRGG